MQGPSHRVLTWAAIEANQMAKGKYSSCGAIDHAGLSRLPTEGWEKSSLKA